MNEMLDVHKVETALDDTDANDMRRVITTNNAIQIILSALKRKLKLR